MKKLLISLLAGGIFMFGANAQSSQGAQNAKKTVVCYFSATGTTERLAKTAASALGADIHEIVPVHKYTSADLNWHDSNSLSSIECNDEKSRPAIANSSGGSGLGRSGSDLAKHAKGAVLKGGREFRGSASGAEVKKYIDGILE